MDRDSILVIEDEAIVAMDISNTLESLGYRVLSWLKSGEEALDFMHNEQPDLILMDIKLKGKLDGIQTATSIRKYYDLPVIFLTAYSDKETLDRAKLSLPYGYITKSFNINDLRSTIEMALYKHKMEKKLREQQQIHDISLNTIQTPVFTVTKEGNLRFFNRAAEELIGKDSYDTVGMSLDAIGFFFLDQDGQTIMPSYLRERIGETDRYVCTFVKDSIHIPVECSFRSYSNEQGSVLGYVIVLRDIRDELKYYEVQSKLASIVEHSDDAIISLSMDGTILSWNNSATRMFGYKSSDVIGKNFIILTPSFLPDNFPGILEKMKTGAHQNSFETIRKRKDGTILNVSLMISPIKNHEGVLTGVSVISRDITEKKNLEAAVLEITEKERIRIGQDLHDSLGQHLTGIMLNMKVLEKDLQKSGSTDTCSSASKISELVREGIQKTKDLAKNLAPPIIESEGVREALKVLVSTVEDLYRIETVLKTDRNHIEPDGVVVIQMYRIAQEALHNAVKHSGATRIDVSLLAKGKNELLLLISDNGKGIEKNAKGGMGISIMNYRADMINGILTVSKGPEGGTRVSCRIPI